MLERLTRGAVVTVDEASPADRLRGSMIIQETAAAGGGGLENVLVGTATVSAVYVGTTAASRVYVGTTLVWGA